MYDNFIQGNKNWMRAREGVMRCDSLNCSKRELANMLPIVNDTQSDSGALDNVMELLVRSGRDIPEVMMMLIPEAWQNDALMDQDRKDFYRYSPSPHILLYCNNFLHAFLVNRCIKPINCTLRVALFSAPEIRGSQASAL
jgi:hypothetical protein